MFGSHNTYFLRTPFHTTRTVLEESERGEGLTEKQVCVHVSTPPDLAKFGSDSGIITMLGLRSFQVSFMT
jgi:hypothetical protein